MHVPQKTRIALSYKNEIYQDQLVIFKNNHDQDSIISKVANIPENTLLDYSISIFKDGKLDFIQQSILPDKDTIDLKQGSNYKIHSLGKPLINDILTLFDPFKENKIKMGLADITGLYQKNNESLFRISDQKDKETLILVNKIDFYTRYFGFLNSNNKILANKKTISRFKKEAPELQLLKCTQISYLFVYFTRYLIITDKKDPNDISNNFDYAIKAGWNKGITIGYLLDKLQDYRGRNDTKFKQNLIKLKTFAGTEYAKYADSAIASYTPKIENPDKINLIKPDQSQTNLQAINNENNHKLILIDFWASWCVPCREEAPQFEAYKNKFKDKDIAFVSISLDEDDKTDLWLKALKDDKLENTTNHYKLVTPKKSLLFKHFSIASIPRYILMDHTGKIINSDFYRPSDKEFESNLNGYLKQ